MSKLFFDMESQHKELNVCKTILNIKLNSYLFMARKIMKVTGCGSATFLDVQTYLRAPTMLFI